MLTPQALNCFEGNDDRNGGTIWSCATGPWHPLKRVRPKSKEDRIIQLNFWEVHTYANCEATSNIGEPQTPRSIKNASPFRQTMTDYISRVNGVETYDIKGKEALTGDWKELNKETYVCNICLQSDFKVYFCPQM